MAKGDSHDLEGFFEKHGIDPEVGEARGYIPWTTENPEPVYKAWPDQKNQDFARRRIATKSDGLAMTRHAPEGLDLPRPYAELRPDEDVLIDKHPEWHDERPPNPEERKRLKRKWIHTAEERSEHIEEDEKDGGHGGKRVNGVHPAETWTHYVFPKGPHAKRLDVPPFAQGTFKNAERAFFCNEGLVKADALVSELRATGEAQAVFDAASVTLWPWRRERDDLEQTWRDSELERFARYDDQLMGKPVYIIPDADWYENWQVFRQAMLTRSFLRRLGVDARVASTDIDLYRSNRKLKAFDDVRSAYLRDELPQYTEGLIAELIEVDRLVPKGIPLLVKHRWAGCSTRIDRYGAWMLEALSLHAGIHIEADGKTPIFTDDGILRGAKPGGRRGISLKTLGLISGMDPRTAQRTMVDFCETDAIEKIAGSHEIIGGDFCWRGRKIEDAALKREEVLVRHPKLKPREVYRAPYEYVDQPTYQLHKDLRADGLTFKRIGKSSQYKAPPMRSETDLREADAVEVETLLHQGFSHKEIEEFTEQSLDHIKKFSAAAKLNGWRELGVDGDPATLAVASPQGPTGLRFKGQRGQQLALALTGEGYFAVTVRVKGPRDRLGPPLYESEVGAWSGAVLVLDIKNTGRHTVELSPAVELVELDYLPNGKVVPAPVFTGFVVVTAQLRSLPCRQSAEVSPMRPDRMADITR